jgi:predicted phosphoribosyltransferase
MQNLRVHIIGLNKTTTKEAKNIILMDYPLAIGAIIQAAVILLV